jgi:hypothetical protein
MVEEVSTDVGPRFRKRRVSVMILVRGWSRNMLVNDLHYPITYCLNIPP